MSGTNGFSYEQLCARLKEMDALVAAIRHEEVDAIVGEKKVVLLNSTRRFEEDLRASREQFRIIYDASPNAIALFDPDGKMIHVNKSCLSLFGVEDVRDILTFDILSLKRLDRELYEDILAGKPVNYQSRLDLADAASHGLMNCRKKGVLIIDVVISPMLRPTEKTVSGYMAKILDITAQKRVEERVAFQSTLLESVNEAVVATGMDGRIIYWGKGAENMFGNSEQEMLCRPAGDVFGGEVFFEEWVGSIKETGSSAAEYEKRQPDGDVLWLSATLSLLRNSDGNFEGVVGILRDITERKRAADALEGREKQLEMLCRKIITVQEEERKRLARELHDSFGQKIISLQLEIEWLKNREYANADKDVYKSMVGLTVDASEELHRICMGLRPLTLDKIGFISAIKVLIEEFETNCDVMIKASIMPVDETLISPDAAINLYRILQESLTNVVRHSNSKTAIVSLREESAELVLEVKDKGCGLAEDESLRRYNFGILGMRERANMSGGRFEISSTPGKGTHVRVSVPVGKPVGGPSV